MIHRGSMSRIWFGAAIVLISTACAPLPAATRTKQAPPPEQTAEVAEPSIGNTAEELRHLMDAGSLTELRTTYNGNYGASLLFHADSLNYYVTLFRDKQFWRVIRTSSVEQAEQVYKTFVDQTNQLSQVYIDTVRLEAGKRYTERMVELNQKRLQGLQAEVEQQRQQALQVSNALQQNKQQAVSLSSDLRATNTELEALTRRIEQLQQQQGNPALELPPTPATAPAAPSPSVPAPGTD
ncbi:DUF2968 domain-containing protein [Pseudoxanthomonas winnipegensis]|uniref:DUF2968 domain-containing protein n=2 Tax=Pseudoxanthomonas winnipegensis TaxID=2480810 RepID=A0A4Q8LND1_9GAMM|nr:DUF2968 domain-containing protein [Pseudoxanthomonas winnipegensis]TAA31782.1 DUF2968 domain-containing protein [Pseudoxanthomonas winnipegensis]